MNSSATTEIDGRRLYYMFVAGAKKIIENQIKLNKINVFPVNDGDTGSNMASTIRAVIDSVKPSRSYKLTLDLIADSTLVNARGNSGIIFAQFIHGVSTETAELEKISIQQFAESIKKSVSYVYEAVANPVEGTMLTIIKEWADFVYRNKNNFKDFNQIFLHSKKILDKALLETKAKLQVLKTANVVDAGANAFVFFIEGMIEFIQSKNIRALVVSKEEIHAFQNAEVHISDDIQFRYCTEAIIKNLSLNHKPLTKILQDYGDSVVVAGAEKTSRIHVHTNDPAKLFNQLQDYGTITFQKAEDMIRQNESVGKRKWNIALVTDSACDLSVDLIDNYQINMLPINIYFGDNHYLDKVTIQAEQFYNRINQKGDYPKTAQINEIAFSNLYSHLASHYDAVIAVHLTEKFSGTYFNSQKAAEKVSKEFGKPITVIDSKNVSGAIGLIVLRIAEAIEKGDSYSEIIENAEKWVSDSRIFVSVRTLKYMVRGGRVSPLKGLLAKIMNVNPIVSMDEKGASMIFGKSYNQKSNMIKVMNHIREVSANKEIWNYVILHADNLEAAHWYETQMKSLTGKDPVSFVEISPVIGANAGIGAASVAFMYN